MTFTREELRTLLGPGMLAAAFLLAGAAVIWLSSGSLSSAQAALAAAQAERRTNNERLARISEEEREVNEKIDLYKRLKGLNILGEERRLEWADAINRIRRSRELLDLRYVVERQRLLVSAPGKPASVDFYASTMRVDMALLHEEDLLRFLADLRQSGNAFYSVKRCTLLRTGQAGGAATMAPRLRGECDIDLVTIRDRGAKEAGGKP
jgi:hypothetical protein